MESDYQTFRDAMCLLSMDRQLSVALAYWEINKEDLNES